MQRRISHLQRRLKRQARKEVFEWARKRSAVGRRARTENATKERDASACISVCCVGHVAAMQFAPELDRVVARGAGNVVDELHDGVWSLKLRPLESTQAGEEISTKPDARQSASVRTREASVEPI